MKMLVIIGNYLPLPHANGICTHQVILELQKRGHQVHALCYDSSGTSDENKQLVEGVQIHRVRGPILNNYTFMSKSDDHGIKWKLGYTISKWFTRMMTILYLPFYPLNSIGLVYRYYSKAKKIYKNEKFDRVIAVYRPLEAVVAGALISKKYKEIKSCMYVLDTLTSINNKSTFLNLWFKKSGWLWENRLYKVYNCIINMKSYEEFYANARYDKYRNKIVYADIPLLDNSQKVDIKIKSIGVNRKWLYCGTLDSHTRDPEYLCKMFTLNKRLYNDEIHFYSNGNCEDIIGKYSIESGGKINQHGYISRTKILEEIKDADILVSIGNKNSSMVPSKIFEYISTGKKIIHFYKSKDDSCIAYLTKYKNALLIDETIDIADNIMKVEDFLNKKLEKVLQQDIDILFALNKPSYTASIIENF